MQWNDFKENAISSFEDLRQDKDFTDVTLACEDGHKMEAHKVVLVASSPFFLNILKRNKHPHPLVYMRGVRSENLLAMLDFFYHGEANVRQEYLESFLVFAEELQLKGLRENQSEKDLEEIQQLATQVTHSEFLEPKLTAKENTLKQSPSTQNGLVQAVNESTLALVDFKANQTDLENLDQHVKSMMKNSDNADPYRRGKLRICKVRGKEGSRTAIMNHVEANHISGISLPCDLCGKLFTSRNTLNSHQSKYHRNE